jgi:hypothetical protein
MVGTSRTAVVNVNVREYGIFISSSARPKSSGEVVIKKSENDEMSDKNLKVMEKAKVKETPVIKFMTKISMARYAAPLSEPAHFFMLLEKKAKGICAKKRIIRGRSSVNMRAKMNIPITMVNLALGSILCNGVSIFLNLNPSNTLIDIG